MTAVDPQRAEAPLVLTVDIGTSSTRAMLFDRHGRPVAGVAVQERAQPWRTEGGAAEQPAEVLLAQVAHCIDGALLAAGPLADQIGAVALDTLVSNIVALDAAGRPLTPLISYADTRNAADAEALRARLDEAAAHDRTGCLLRTSYWPARLAWFARTQPEVARAAARWVTLGEYIELQLFGHCRVSYSAASWSGLLDRRALAWDAPLLDALGVAAERLSPLVDRDAPLSDLLPDYARRWPALRAVPWFPAVGDGAAANIGSGCAEAGQLALTVGTTGALRVVLPALDRVPAGLWCYRVDRARLLLGGATSEGGNLYAWMRGALQLGDRAEVERALAATQPDGHGLTVLPFLAGERSPGWSGDARATISGITLSTTPLDLLQAGLEAVAYRFALIARLVCGERGPSRLVASGGALLASPFWMQVFADVLGSPLVASAEQEATSRGVALLALEALGAIPDIAALPAAEGQLFTPDPARHERYAAALARQRQLYATLLGG